MEIRKMTDKIKSKLKGVLLSEQMCKELENRADRVSDGNVSAYIRMVLKKHWGSNKNE